MRMLFRENFHHNCSTKERGTMSEKMLVETALDDLCRGIKKGTVSGRRYMLCSIKKVQRIGVVSNVLRCERL